MAILLRPALPSQERNAATVGLAATAAVALDVDAIGRLFGGGDVAFMGGHRALTHSVTAAVVLAAVGGLLLVGRGRASSVKAVFPYLAAVIMSHGVLDMFTTYGEGVELLAPFSTARFAFPWKLFSDSLLSEILMLWIPALRFLALPRLRSLRLVATAAFASAALGLGVGLLALSSPHQLRAYLSILQERMSSAGRFSPDSTRRLIAAAEAGSSSAAAQGDAAAQTPAGARRCVAVRSDDAVALSGDVTAGGWSEYRTSWTLGGGRLWWLPARRSGGSSDTATLSVRAIRLDRPLPPGAEREGNSDRVQLRPISRAGDTLLFTLNRPRRGTAYRYGVRVPTPGRWLFIATMGDNWGCFIFRV